MRRVWKGAGMVVLATLILSAGLVTAGVRPAVGQQADHRITICHDVEGNGNTGNGYDIITVDKDSIVNETGELVPNGHGTHSGDVIPAFAAGTGPGNSAWGAFPGQGNAAIIDNRCAEVTTTTTTTEPPTTTTTTTPPTTTETTQTTTTEPPPTTTETTTTTTTSPPETQPSTTTETETTETTSPPELTPPPKQPKPKPPSMKPPPKNAPPGAPPICPPTAPTTERCGPQGNG